jgi:hypothetical protein
MRGTRRTPSEGEAMRLQKDIAKLDEMKLGVTFPRADYGPNSFTRFKNNIREILAENGLGSDWNYDEDSGHFCSSTEEQITVDGFRGSMKIHLTLDPQMPLREEIARLIEQKTSFRTMCARRSC